MGGACNTEGRCEMHKIGVREFKGRVDLGDLEVLSTYLSVCLSIYLSIALQLFIGSWSLFQLILYTVGRTT
jgi:hypothetical protein